jgi:similar to spore coat protein
MDNSKLAPHEALEIREFLNMEVLGVKKLSDSMDRVKDTDLKCFMRDSLALKRNAIQEITSIISNQIQL